MSKTTPTKMGRTEVITLIPTTFEKPGNYPVWLESIKLAASDLGRLACFFQTGLAYVEPVVTPAMYNPVAPLAVQANVDPEAPAAPPVDNADVAMTQGIINKRRENAYLRYDTAIVANRKKTEEFSGFLWSTLSQESKDKVKELAGAQLAQSQLACDTLQIFLWIQQSHLTNAFGAGVANVEVNRDRLDESINVLQQKDSSLAAFALEYRNARLACNAGGCAAVSNAADAIKFIKRLNSSYAEMIKDMAWRAAREEPNAYPATVEDCVRIAAAWQISIQQFSPHEAQERAYKTDASPPVRDRSARHNKNKSDHVVGEKKIFVQYDKNSPNKQERLMAWRQSDEGKALIKTYKCYNCDKVGHLSRDCKAPRRAVVLATEEESLFDDDFLADDAKDYAGQTFDDDESQHWTFSTRAVIFNPVDEIMPKLVEASSDSDNDQEEVEMSKQRQQSFLQLEYRRRMQQKKLEEEQLEKRAANTRVFFTAEAESSNIGMDSQSSVHIFKDETLLTRIRKADHPVLIGGINKAAPKIKITKQGDFDGISVLVHSSASCNIFSQSKLKADGARISYLESTDCFLLHPVGSTTIYKFRSVSSHGSVGKFYVSSAADRVLYPTDHDCRKAYVKLRLLDHQKVSAAEKSAADKALSSSDGPFLGELALVSSHLPVHNSSLLRSLDNALDENFTLVGKECSMQNLYHYPDFLRRKIA